MPPTENAAGDTELAVDVTDVVPTFLPKDPLRRAHMEDIISGGDGLESGFAAGLLLGQIERNRKTLALRNDAATTLATKVPALQNLALVARKECQQWEALVSECPAKSISQLLGDCEAICGNREFLNTLTTRNEVIGFIVDRTLTAKENAREASRKAEEAEKDAKHTLLTTANKALLHKNGEIGFSTQAVRNSIITATRFLADIDREVAACMERCETLFRGVDPDGIKPKKVMFDCGVSEKSRIEKKYRRERTKLVDLQEQQASKSSVEATRSQNEKKLAALVSQQEDTYASLLLPENMDFCWE